MSARLQRAWSIHLKPAGYSGKLRRRRGDSHRDRQHDVCRVAVRRGDRARRHLRRGEVEISAAEQRHPGQARHRVLAGRGRPPGVDRLRVERRRALLDQRGDAGGSNDWFGDKGIVNTKTPEVMQTGMDVPYSHLSSPTIFKNLIITGAGTGEGPGGSNGGSGPAGDTRAWDATTGKLVWTFHTVPRPGEFGYDTWGGESAKNRSGVNVWGYMSLDAARGILYMPLGAPNNDRVGTDRPGNNLFSSSVVAVDANTGKYLWHFQLVHHDVWDYDTQSAPLVVDLQRGGETIPALLVVNKTGLLFTLNRVTGKPIFDVVERPVPKSDVPGEQASPTQPFPVKPEPLTQMTHLARQPLQRRAAAPVGTASTWWTTTT